MLKRRVYEGEVVICWDSPGEPVVLRRERSDLTMDALSNIIANNYLGNRICITIEVVDGGDGLPAEKKEGGERR